MKSLHFSLIFALSCLITPSLAEVAGDSEKAFVVCPEVFRSAMEPWIDYREKQGYQVQLISSEGTNGQIRDRIQKAAANQRPAAILLVGDAAPPSVTDAVALARSVPNFRTAAKVNVRFHGAPHIGTDNNYADLDGDRVPDVPLGRLSVDTPEELSTVIEKIIAYESAPPESWQRNINLVAGVGGFGALIDGAIDFAAWHLVKQIPDHYQITMTQAAWRSPFCPTPARFPETVMQQINKGPLFWVYMGHGARGHLDRLRTPQDSLPVLTAENAEQFRDALARARRNARWIMTMDDLDQLRHGQGRTIALMLACLTGKYDAASDSLAERMVATPGGPVAVIATSRVAMPYSMSIVANGIMKQILAAKTATLGEMFLTAKCELAEEKATDENRAMIDQLAQTFSPTRDVLPEERLEHLELFNLFGDPLLRLPCPEVIEIDLPEKVKKGEKLKISGSLPFAGKMTIELVRSRRRPDYSPAKRSKFPETPEGFAEMQQTYEKANTDHFHRQGTTDVKAGPVEMTIAVPPSAPGGRCAVRIYLTDGKQSAIGSREVLITK